jgi:hypothetical protein
MEYMGCAIRQLCICIRREIQEGQGDMMFVCIWLSVNFVILTGQIDLVFILRTCSKMVFIHPKSIMLVYPIVMVGCAQIAGM